MGRGAQGSTIHSAGRPPRQCSNSTRHLVPSASSGFELPALRCRRLPAPPGTPVTRQRLTAARTPPPLRPPPSRRDSTSPSTPVPSAASIRRRPAARPIPPLPATPPVSATTPLTARQRSVSSIAHSMSSCRRSPETTSSCPASIPKRTRPGAYRSSSRASHRSAPCGSPWRVPALAARTPPRVPAARARASKAAQNPVAASSPATSWMQPRRSPPPGRARSILETPKGKHGCSGDPASSIPRIVRRSASVASRLVFGIVDMGRTVYRIKPVYTTRHRSARRAEVSCCVLHAHARFSPRNPSR